VRRAVAVVACATSAARPSGVAATIAPMSAILGSAATELRDVLRAATATHRRLRDHLLVIAVVTVGVDLVCAVVAFLFERHSPETDIQSFGSALFWTSTQLLTVSSSVKNPISTPGRVLDVLMEIYAITVIATLAGSFGSFLQRRGEEIREQTEKRLREPVARA
jgi:hypothetical protein